MALTIIPINIVAPVEYLWGGMPSKRQDNGFKL